jgi:hypothetical protein
MARNELDCVNDCLCYLKLQLECYIYVAGIRLAKTENPSTRATANCKECRSAAALGSPVAPSCVNMSL